MQHILFIKNDTKIMWYRMTYLIYNTHTWLLTYTYTHTHVRIHTRTYKCTNTLYFLTWFIQNSLHTVLFYKLIVFELPFFSFSHLIVFNVYNYNLCLVFWSTSSLVYSFLYNLQLFSFMCQVFCGIFLIASFPLCTL